MHIEPLPITSFVQQAGVLRSVYCDKSSAYDELRVRA